MKKLVLLVVVLGSLSFSSVVSADVPYHWYHPTGKKCPTYSFSPNQAGSRESALKRCQAEHGSCSESQGTAIWAC